MQYACLPAPRVSPTCPALPLLLLLQVEKAVRLRRAKLVLLAPNIASLAAADGDEGDGQAPAPQRDANACPATALVTLADDSGVPLVFALSRQRMGKVSGAGLPRRT